ncbi:hypothetical protein AAG570_009630, partial [Ranatra chinensis]
SYITPCSRNDPDLENCVVRNGQKAIPYFVNGDPKYRVPRLDPFFVPELSVSQGNRQLGLRLTLRDTETFGLRNATFTRAKLDLKAGEARWDFKIPRIEILGQYSVSGQILILPVFGNGLANITLTMLELGYKHSWGLVQRKGKEYMEFTEGEIIFKTGRTYFDLQNLFNGDKLLGENMNMFLNQHWEEVIKELGPVVAEAVSKIFSLMLSNIAQLVPYSEIYPDT